ncbi:DNRLRE domain-containing protein [Planctomycetota bacterium]
MWLTERGGAVLVCAAVAAMFNCLMVGESLAQTRVDISQDAHVDSTAPGSNYGGASLLVAGDDSLGVYWSYLKPDLSGLPTPGPNYSVTSAWLKVYCYQATSDPWIAAYQSSGYWSEGSVTYSNRPAPGTQYYEANGGSGWWSFDITSYIDYAWIQGHNNWGIILKGSAGPNANPNDENAIFRSSENSTTSQRPYVDIYFSVDLAELRCQSHSGSVSVSWLTSDETDNAGWNIFRSSAKDAGYFQLNSAIVPAYQYGYLWEDLGVHNGSKFFYQLEDLDLDGTRTRHGPVWAIPSPADLDSSQRVDGLDLIALCRAMGSREGDEGWNARADLDGNGVVGPQDREIFDSYYGLALSGR